MYSVRADQTMHTTHKDQMACFCSRKESKMTTSLEMRLTLIVNCCNKGGHKDRITTIKDRNADVSNICTKLFARVNGDL